MIGSQTRIYRVTGYDRFGEKTVGLVAAVDAYRAMADYGGHKVYRPTSCMPAEMTFAW